MGARYRVRRWDRDERSALPFRAERRVPPDQKSEAEKGRGLLLRQRLGRWKTVNGGGRIRRKEQVKDSQAAGGKSAAAAGTPRKVLRQMVGSPPPRNSRCSISEHNAQAIAEADMPACSRRSKRIQLGRVHGSFWGCFPLVTLGGGPLGRAATHGSGSARARPPAGPGALPAPTR